MHQGGRKCRIGKDTVLFPQNSGGGFYRLIYKADEGRERERDGGFLDVSHFTN